MFMLTKSYFWFTAYIEDSILNQSQMISEQRVLDMIENAYPNPLTVEDFVT